MQNAIELLVAVVPEFEALATNAKDRLLFWSMPDTAGSLPAVSELREQLNRYGISLLLHNRDLSQIAAREIRLLVDALQCVSFTRPHADCMQYVT
jgi:hypothetical protein